MSTSPVITTVYAIPRGVRVLLAITRAKKRALVLEIARIVSLDADVAWAIAEPMHAHALLRCESATQICV